MQFVALLRGINVGGNNKVEMSRLKTLFENLGYQEVRTYINSGNIIFKSKLKDHKELASKIEEAIKSEFGFPVTVVTRDSKQIKAIVKAIPESWQNNAQMKCDVIFLWEEIDSKQILKDLNLKSSIDKDVKYIPGTIIWRLDKKDVNKSALLKLVGTPIYKKMTIRNCNTVRKLLSLMSD